MKKSKIDPLEEYFLIKFKEMGIEIIPPEKIRIKKQSALSLHLPNLKPQSS